MDHLNESKRSDIGFDEAIGNKSKGDKGYKDDGKRFNDENIAKDKMGVEDEVVEGVEDLEEKGGIVASPR